MSFNITGGALDTYSVKLTTTGATSILPSTIAAKRVVILSITASEITGATPTLSLELYDGTTSFYIRNARAMGARATETFNEPIIKGQKSLLRATASAANQIDMTVTFIAPDAPGR